MWTGQRILVALGLNDQDASVVAYSSLVHRAVTASRIYFMHVAGTLDLPPDVRAQFPEVEPTGEDVAESRMRQAVGDHFAGSPGPEIRYEVATGAPLVPLLAAARRHEVDLLVSGRNPGRTTGGTLAERLARKAPCSILIVPRGSPAAMKRILVPIDFSTNSGDALDAAVRLARSDADSTIACVHIYRVPIGYHACGKTYEEFADLMRSQAQRSYEQFMRSHDTTGVRIEPRFILNDNTAVAIHQAAEMFGADLIVLGARGRTDCAAAMLGSITERCLATTPVPLLAVKRKGDNMNLLEAILSL